MNERVGNAQRNQVVELLNEALGGGYLDLAEYERRLTDATAAQTTGDLVGQLADLPVRFHWDPRTPAVTVPAAADRSVATRTTLALVCAISALPLAACYGLGALPGLVAIALAGAGRRSPQQRAKALAATVIGVLAVALSVAVVVLLVTVA
jgi:hypothetical protein